MDEGRSICLTLSFSRRPVGDAGCRATVVKDVESTCMHRNSEDGKKCRLCQPFTTFANTKCVGKLRKCHDCDARDRAHEPIH